MKSTFLACLFLTIATFVVAQDNKTDKKEKNWSNEFDLQLSGTSGNSETENLSFKNTYLRKWAKSKFTSVLSGQRARAADISVYGVEQSDGSLDFTVDKTKNTNDEDFDAKFKYVQVINKKLDWHSSLDWESNRIGGVDSRVEFTLGLGNKLIQTDKTSFELQYGGVYVSENLTEVIEDDDQATYGGLRVSWDWKTALSKTATFTQSADLTQNLNDTDDSRAEMSTNVQAQINGRWSLKLSVNFTYDRQPSFVEVPVFSDDTLADQVTTTLFELEELDTYVAFGVSYKL